MANKDSIKLETTHLRVYIHCEGCRKKVKKILTKLEGVYSVDINASLGKVSVTGTADPKMLMKKLEKSGKVVELWPQVAPANHEDKKKEETPPVHPSPREEDTKSKPKPARQEQQHGGDMPAEPKKKKINEDAEKKENGVKSPLKTEMKSDKKLASGSKDCTNSRNESKVAIDKSAQDDTKPESTSPCGPNAGAADTSSNDNDRVNNVKNSGTNNNTRMGENCSVNIIMKGDANGCAGGGQTNTDVDEGGNSGSGDGNSPADQSKKRVETSGMSITEAKLHDDEVVPVESSSPPYSSTNKLLHVATPSMVLVETSEYSVDTEPIQDQYNATHMFSDENANNCTLM